MNLAIVVPEGFRNLRKEVSYILLRNNPAQPAVLVYFDSQRNAHLEHVSQQDFQEGLSSRKILPKPGGTPTLPPWLAHLIETDLDLNEAFVTDAGERGKTHLALIEERLAFILPAHECAGEILSNTNPDRLLNRFANNCEPKQNLRRYRNWFYTYLAFGANKWALLPPMFDAGRWDRLDPKWDGKKFGRESKQGRSAGYGTTKELFEKSVAGFALHVQVGSTLTEVYRDTLKKTFGCRVERVDDRAHYTHPEGAPYPSFWQYKRHCEKHYGKDGIQRALMGDQTFRLKVAATQGAYSSELSNLAQLASGDATWTKDVARNYVNKQPLSKLCVAKYYCSLSGYLLGVGFSLSETKNAYNAALFCMAIPKKRFAEILGLTIEEDDWLGNGLAADFKTDGGPGRSAKLGLTNEARARTPAYTPQSNSTIESRHERQKAVKGAPEFRASKLTPIEMARRELKRLITQTRTSSAEARVTIDMVGEGVRTPRDIWKYLDAQMRNDAQAIEFDQAVRRFLVPVEFNIEGGRIKLHGLPYNSHAFQATATCRRLKNLKGGKLEGYVLEIAVRKAWVVVEGSHIVEVDVQLPIRVQSNELYLSLSELESYKSMRSSAEYSRKEGKPAEDDLAIQEFEEQTGASWGGGTTLRGTAKRAPASARSLLPTDGGAA